MLTAAIVLAVSASYAETLYYVSPVSNGVYAVQNGTTGQTVYVRNVEAYLKSKRSSGKVEGFGKSISTKEFAEGSTPVEDTVEAVARPVGHVAGTAYNVANMYPSWRKYTTPLKAVFGSNKKRSLTGTGF